MKGYYESNRESTGLLVTRPEQSFNSHFHINLEIYLIKNGKYSMELNEQSFTLDNGSIFIVDSYEIHGYTRLSKNDADDSRIIIIPYKYLSYFNKVTGDKKIKNPHIIDINLCQKLIDFIDCHINTAQSEDSRNLAIDYFLSLLCEKLQFVQSKTNNNVTLIKKILNYIHDNYTKDISRKTISTYLGYNEEYISRVFHYFIKTSISKYVNNLRLDYVEENKKLNNKSITELIFEAGFNSQRTYFRAKKNR